MLKRRLVAATLAVTVPFAAISNPAFSWGLGPVNVPDISIPAIPSIPSIIPTLPGFGPLEKPVGDLGITAIQLNGQINDFINGKLPVVNLPYIGPVSTMDSFQDGIIQQGLSAMDWGLGQLARTGLPIPQRGILANPAGVQFANAIWKSNRLKGACITAGQSCGPLATRLAQASVESSPTRAKFCQVMMAVQDNRSGFGDGFNGAMTRNIRMLVPNTAPVAVDFHKPRC